MLWVFLLLFSTVYCDFPIDNEIIGEPTVDCEDTLVGLTFKTKKPFSGRVYVQGLSDDERCASSFPDNRNMSRISMHIENGDCTMQRHRVTGKMEGLMFSVTVVVSFHGTFVTRADRAFRCICFFRNQKTLTNSIQISGIRTTELMNPVSMPTCSYSIRSGSPDGPQVIYGEVGDKIFHVWHCDAPDKAFLVHSCHVTDGRGYRFDLLDVNGCAIDPVIQPDIVYNDTTNTAVAETYGYKFSDTNVLNYECVIEVCIKSNGDCKGLTPPVCQRDEVNKQKKIRTRRAARENEAGSIEVAASINMVDHMKEALNETLTENGPISVEGGKTSPAAKLFCMGIIPFVLLILLLILFLIVCTVITLHYSRMHTYIFDSSHFLDIDIGKRPEKDRRISGSVEEMERHSV